MRNNYVVLRLGWYSTAEHRENRNIRYQKLRLAVSTLEMQLKWTGCTGDFLLNINNIIISLPSSFTVSDMASLSSFSTSTCTASLEPLTQQTKLATSPDLGLTGTHLMDRLAKRGESSKLLAEPHSIKTGLLVLLI